LLVVRACHRRIGGRVSAFPSDAGFFAPTPHLTPNVIDDASLAAVRAVDPAFDSGAFLTAAAALFRDVRNACNDGSLDAVAGHVGGEFAAAFAKRARFMTTTSHRRDMSAIDAVTPQLHGMEVRPDGSVLAVVRFDVVGRMGQIALDADVAPASQLAGLPTRSWYEIWRLARPAGVATPPAATSCPTCGAPAAGGSHCRYCGTLLVDAGASFVVESVECMG
jgi:hypothetical protein